MTQTGDRISAALADRYRIERELGQGGMATVYLAQDLKHDRRVALKLLRGGDAGVTDRLLAEARSAARLDSVQHIPGLMVRLRDPRKAKAIEEIGHQTILWRQTGNRRYQRKSSRGSRRRRALHRR